MPQLSPLNWIFLFILFWLVVCMIFVMIWWKKKYNYAVMTSPASETKSNTWNW